MGAEEGSHKLRERKLFRGKVFICIKSLCGAL